MHGLLAAAMAAPRVPTWSAGTGPFATVQHEAQLMIERASPANGTYNHAAMIGYHAGVFTAAWKNGASTEDKDGQRILVSQSTDGVAWSPSAVLFPCLSVEGHPAAMFVGPPLVIRGRQYIGAAPGKPLDAAAGAQFCLWPEPIAPKNCGPPHGKRQNGLLMREVEGVGRLGPIFWAADAAPPEWEKASARFGVRVLKDMPAETRADVAALGRLPSDRPPCDAAGGTLKCEACRGGCQLYDAINLPPVDKPAPSAIGNERTHYEVPSGGGDVLLYRTDRPVLYASTRAAGGGQDAWVGPTPTDIPTDETNINAGPLPGGAVYLLSNPIYIPKNRSGLGQLRFRNPITVAISDDGATFPRAVAVINCTELPAASGSGCAPRFGGGGKNPGPSYPQGMAVVAPAPQEHRGFYVINSNNKEDVWLTKVSFAALGLQ